MNKEKNYYEILGVSRNATSAQIKRSYKELVRKYHPDVSNDKEQAHAMFLLINEAYEVLGSQFHRREYDRNLPPLVKHKFNYSANQEVKNKESSFEPNIHGADIYKYLARAKDLLAQKKYSDAASTVNHALKLDEKNPRAYAVMGDIYKAQGRTGMALKAYSLVLQLNPNDRQTEEKLTELMSKKIGKQMVTKGNTGPTFAQKMSVTWWGIALIILMFPFISPGKPMESLKNMKMISLFSSNLVLAIIISSVIIGAMLCYIGKTEHPDEELVFENGAGRWSIVPTTIMLVISSVIWFPIAAGLYIVLGFIQQSISRSISIVIGAVAAVVIISALLYQPVGVDVSQAKFQVLSFGGNFSFLPMVAGWYIGSMFANTSLK